jgi:hypothetical protein
MGATDPTRERRSEDCSTTTSFADHGIADGADLVSRTGHRLSAVEDLTFAPTDRFFDRLEEAFVWACLGSVDEPGVPPHVEAAIDDARVATAAEFADREGADVRTEVVPSFFRHLAGFHCAYRSETDG